MNPIHIPNNLRVAVLTDFHTNGKVHVGLKYWLYFDLHGLVEFTVKENTKADSLMPFFVHKRIFVLNDAG